MSIGWGAGDYSFAVCMNELRSSRLPGFVWTEVVFFPDQDSWKCWWSPRFIRVFRSVKNN